MKSQTAFIDLLVLGTAGMLMVSPSPAEQAPGNPPPARHLKVNISWGHRSPRTTPFRVSFLVNQLAIGGLQPRGFEPGDTLQNGVCETRAGAGDVDGVAFVLDFPEREVREIRNLQQIWAYLIAHSDTDTAQRLRLDAGYRPDSRKLTVQMDAEETRGFSLTVDQLLTKKVFWVPALDLFVSSGEEGVTFAEHLDELSSWRGQRVIQQLERQPEASYEQYTSLWEDMGGPAYTNPAAVPPGHIVCLSWDSAIPKFGVDRGANVWNDYGNPDHFRFSYDFGDLGSPDWAAAWKSQKLSDGLPLIRTTIERHGVRYEVEQFAYPLHGPPSQRRGDIAMVLLQKLRLTELQGRSCVAPLGITCRRELASTNAIILVRTNQNTLTWEEAAAHRSLLTLEGTGLVLQSNSVVSGKWQTIRSLLAVNLPADSTREFVLKLPSAPVNADERDTLLALDWRASRETTRNFWSDYLARGARFIVPEEPVNELFRANLWHALRLPRRHGGTGGPTKIDLPYSNFAYDQSGTPWPVNQAVYVDYMLYDLRGYHALAAEELESIYRNNQEPNGHVGGFANWGVYTPGMIYAVAQHWLLSGDRASLEKLLPPTLHALDWCLAEMKKASQRDGPTRGLVLAPLNDLSHDPKPWAFNQAYLFAGPDLLARVLAEIQHPRAAECRAAAQAMHEAVQRAFAHACMQSPLVQLRDHTWSPYVPADALTPRRLLEIWYPTEVDCGALHLARLKALDPASPLTGFLLNDHEDNLFLRQWGMANEPVYNPHATAYLLRDEPKPAIRAFYSMMACAFSHSTFEPVEHRWSWGQYFGPPSTDGAWFELYRRMLIHERDDGSLLLLQATPRKWLEAGKEIRIERAPTYYGSLSMLVKSRTNAAEIELSIELEQRKIPATLLVRLRHPQARAIRHVTLNGKPWTDFDAAREWIRIPSSAAAKKYEIVARF